MPLLAPSGWHWPPRVVAKTSGRQKTDSEWDSQVIYWMTVAFTFWLLVHSVLQALAIEWTWRAQPLKRDEMSWWSTHTHTHLTSGCRLKRSVARRKTMGWPPNAIQPSETCRLVSAGWWDDKFLKWPCTFRRIGVQNHCFTSRWWAQLKQRAPKKLWTFQVHDRLPPVFLTFCFNLLSPWYSQHSSCFTTLHLPVIRPDHPWPASNRVTSTCSTEASSLGTLSRSFNLSRWEDSTWIRCHILILRPRFYTMDYISPSTYSILLMWTRLWTCFWAKFDVSPRSMVQHLWPGCCPDGSSLPVTLPFVASTSRAAWGVAVGHINYLLLSAPCVFMVTWNAELNLSLPAHGAVLGQFQLNLGTTYTRSLVFVFVQWRYASVSPIGSEWTGLHTIRSSTHALSWAKNTPKTVLKGSTSLQAATRRPFKCFQLENYSTFI